MKCLGRAEARGSQCVVNHMEPMRDCLELLDAQLAGVCGGDSSFTHDQLLGWCNDGKLAMPQNEDLGCAINVAQNVGRQVSQDNYEQIKGAIQRGLYPRRRWRRHPITAGEAG